MHGAHAAGDGFYALGLFIQVVTGVINERWGDVVCRGRHLNVWGGGGGWVGAGLDGC
jgi:hypothetical protein